MSPNRFRGSADQPGDSSSGPLSRPSQLVQASPEQLRSLTRDQDASREALRAVAADPSAPAQDRVAAAVLLDAVLADPSALSSLDPEAAGSAEALALRFSPALRPSALQAMGDQATMQLLTWAAQSSPGVPPVEAAEAAAHLGADDDGRIYGRVSQRAVQIAEQKGLSRALKDRLRRLTDALGVADQQARRQRAEGRTAASQGPGAAPADASAPADPSSSATDPTPASDEAGHDAPHGQDGRPPESWTSADDAALASMLGHAPSDQAPPDQARSDQDPSDRAPSDRGPSDRDPSDSGPESPGSPDAAGPSTAAGAPDAAGGPGAPAEQEADGITGAEPSTETDGRGRGDAPQAPDFGRPVGFDGSSLSGGSRGSEGSSGTAEPTGQWPPPPRDRGIDDRPGTGPGYGSSGTTGSEAPRSYDFRYLGDDTASPSSEAEKAEFRTTLRNWGLFALVIVAVMIIVAIIL